MPITFDRILDLLQDLEASINSFDNLKQSIRDVLRATHLDAETKLSYIDNELISTPPPPRALAQAERKYYNANRRKNERLRDKQREKRRNLGIPERSSTPRMIRTELESRAIDHIRYNAPESESPEARALKRLKLCHDQTWEIYHKRGDKPFPRSALIEFAIMMNSTSEHIIGELTVQGWLIAVGERKDLYEPLPRQEGTFDPDMPTSEKKIEREAQELAAQFASDL